MQDSYIINGGKPLKGEVVLSGAKNASIKLMIAALLCDGPVTLRRVPHNEDNQNLIMLLRELGCVVSLEGHTVTIDPRGISISEVGLLYGSKIRSSFLLFGPLLHRFGTCRIPNPGGCRIGARPIDRITDALQELGAVINYSSETGYYDATLPKSPSGSCRFAKSTHTGTEAVILLAARSPETVVIHNAALEPEIDNLIDFINHAGADIKRDGANIICRGSKNLNCTEPFDVVEDRNEAVTFAAMAYATHGDITIVNLHSTLIKSFIEKVIEAGGGVDVINDHSVRFYWKQRLHATNITTSAHPGYMTDWQPQFGIMMATAEGTSTIHETMLESRLNWVPELRKVGAHIDSFQPHVTDPETIYQFNYDPEQTYEQGVHIIGVDQLHSGVLKMVDIRAGAALAIAALSAEGESILLGANHVERGYEKLTEKIRKLGGDIQLV
ncbi:MAG: UDP-N-acetylglucosamine 1-carboxyvinyltransferase [Candidatus Roizmanbacteria bacterium]